MPPTFRGPDWYFLSLFELLKHFPGPWEPVATMVIPGLVVGFLAALPFLDRGPERRPWSRGRIGVVLIMAVIGIGVTALTGIGLAGTPRKYDPNDWGPRAIAGHQLVTSADNKCARCHVSGGPAAELSITRITKDEEWLLAHMADPVAIAPGVRSESDPAPAAQLTRSQAQAVLAYLRRIRAGADPPALADDDRLAALTFSTACAGCHKISGEGGESGPDLSQVGRRREAESIKRIIREPTSEFPDTLMPSFARATERTAVECAGAIPGEETIGLALGWTRGFPLVRLAAHSLVGLAPPALVWAVAVRPRLFTTLSKSGLKLVFVGVARPNGRAPTSGEATSPTAKPRVALGSRVAAKTAC